MASELEALTRRLEELEGRCEAATRELQVLRDIEEIRQLKYRYFRAMDSADMALLATVVADDFQFDFSGSAFETKGTSGAEFVSQMADNFNNQMATQHQGHHPEISIDADGRHASGMWYLQDIVYHVGSKNILAGTNFYKDRYVRTDDGWKLQSSHWKRHIEVRDTLDQPVNFTDRYLASHGRDLSKENVDA